MLRECFDLSCAWLEEFEFLNVYFFCRRCGRPRCCYFFVVVAVIAFISLIAVIDVVAGIVVVLVLINAFFAMATVVALPAKSFVNAACNHRYMFFLL